jgi:hypothetical protein
MFLLDDDRGALVLSESSGNGKLRNNDDNNNNIDLDCTSTCSTDNLIFWMGSSLRNEAG